MERLSNWGCGVLVLKFITVQNKSPCSFTLSLFPPMRMDLLLSQSKSVRQLGEGGGLSLWETFVTSVTALVDGWAASIWLQCM